MSEDGAGEVQPQQEEEVIPKVQYEKEKHGLLSDLTSKREKIRQLETEVQQLKTNQFQIDPEDLSEAEKALYKKNQELSELQQRLEQEKLQVAEERRKWQAKGLAAKYGVEELDLLKFDTVEEMEKHAIMVENERLKEAVKKAEEEKQKEEKKTSRPKYETASPSASQKPISAMTKQEFEEFVKEQRRQTQTVRR